MNKTNFRWIVVGLLFFITIINYIDRASISYAIDLIAQEFQLSKNQVGLILGAFGIGYTFTTFLGGIAADRYGARHTLFWSTFFWGIATALVGLSNGFLVVFVARVILGFAEGPNFPGMTRAVSDWLPETERNRALSFGLISVPLSLAIGGPIVSQLIHYFSWRGTYFILSIVAFLWLPLWWYLFRDKPQDSTRVNKAELDYINHTPAIQSLLSNDQRPWRVLLLNKTLLVNNWAFFVFGFYLFFFMTWLPNYLKMTFNFDLTKIGFYTVFPWILAAGLMWVVSVVCDRVFKRTQNLRLSRSYPIFISQFLAAVCVIPVIYASSIYTVMIFISLAVGLSMSANAAFYAVNIDIAKARAGTALGIMDAVFAIAGFIAPILTGYIVTWSGHFEAVFWLMAILALSSSLLTAAFHNKNR